MTAGLVTMSQEYPPPPPPTSHAPPSTPGSAGPGPAATRRLLLAVWAALTVAAVGFVFAFGSNCPNADEWEFVPALTGHEPLGPWLWAQHNEHRLPLPRLVYYSLFQLTRDFRAGMLLQVALLSGLSLGLMRLAARLRGRPRWADLFFPVSLLHVGHWENFLIGYNVCFALILVLQTLIGLVALYTTPDSGFRSGLAAGVLAVLLVLCGGGGVVVGLVAAGWLAYLAVEVWNYGAKLRALVLLAFAAFPAVYLALYLDGYHRPAHHPPLGEGGWGVIAVTGETLSMALGGGVEELRVKIDRERVYWGSVVVAAGMLALGGYTLAVLLRMAKSPDDRSTALGLIAIIAGIVGVALVIGLGRAGLSGKHGLASRYGYIMWPLVGLAYLFWVGRGGWGGKWVPLGLCTAAALLYPVNTTHGIGSAAHIRPVLAAVEAEAHAGVPPPEIVRHFPHTFQEGQEERAVRAIPMLREARVGDFAAGDSASDLRPMLPVVGGLVLLVFVARWVWHLGRAVQVERARELFRLQHERFEQMLLTAATETGKPRGLSWVGCEIAGDAMLARDAATRRIVALVPVVIRFEPVPGSEMEDAPAAREPRRATAVFRFVRGHWHTDGRVVFNLDPRQAAAHYGPRLALIEPPH